MANKFSTLKKQREFKKNNPQLFKPASLVTPSIASATVNSKNTATVVEENTKPSAKEKVKGFFKKSWGYFNAAGKATASSISASIKARKEKNNNKTDAQYWSGLNKKCDNANMILKFVAVLAGIGLCFGLNVLAMGLIIVFGLVGSYFARNLALDAKKNEVKVVRLKEQELEEKSELEASGGKSEEKQAQTEENQEIFVEEPKIKEVNQPVEQPKAPNNNNTNIKE